MSQKLSTKSTLHHADMSKYQAFRRNSYVIARAIQPTIDDIASKCIAKDILSETLRPKFVNWSGDKAQKATQLVSAVIHQIEIDESKYDDFVEILAQDPSLNKLVCNLQGWIDQTQQPGQSATDCPEVDYSSKPTQLQNINPTKSSTANVQEKLLTSIEDADETPLASAHSQPVKTFSVDANKMCTRRFTGVQSELMEVRKVSDLECQVRVMER